MQILHDPSRHPSEPANLRPDCVDISVICKQMEKGIDVYTCCLVQERLTHTQPNWRSSVEGYYYTFVSRVSSLDSQDATLRRGMLLSTRAT